MFWGESHCSADNEKTCDTELLSVIELSSCISHALIICFSVFIMVMFLLNVIQKRSLALTPYNRSGLQITSAIYNSLLGLVYLGFAVWVLEEKLRLSNPLLEWLLFSLQGLTWLPVSIVVSLKGKHTPKAPLRLLSILQLIFTGVACVLSLYATTSSKQIWVKLLLDVLTLIGACLLFLCAWTGNKADSVSSVPPFAKAGFLSKLSFWWLNTLMRRGKKRTLQDEDIPKLREEDSAGACYLEYMAQLDKLKKTNPISQPSLLKIIVLCHWKAILVSGLFALVKIITLSSGPLLLNTFIEVAEGHKSFKNEGYALAITLFFSKSLESLAQRQWYFRSRLIGLKVRSLLTAAIFKKQLRLSNAAKKTHSSGQIINYVTVDAYRIGEFPFRFHQIWTTILQICFSLVILYRAVGLATIASMVVIVLTVLCNTPLAKLQNKFQKKLMMAQDVRLKASTEALVNMKVLKFYAWESHFKDAIEKLRSVEYKWLSAVQKRKAFNNFLFWSSPVLVSTATFGACYFLRIPLRASNVFTFVATVGLLRDPIRTFPDIIEVFIQANIAFSRIAKFLEAPELENSNMQKKAIMEMNNHAVFIKSANFSWEENLSKPTLRNVNLEVRPGEKVAICGEVGSGKSTLLAAILGEVPTAQGTIQLYGSVAYVPQSAWIQSGTIRDNILFGSNLDDQRYQKALEKCSLEKDIELLPYGDLTEIGERGVNLSGGQKQRIQLARALYQDCDVYLLDDPFSAVDAHTATSLFNEYVMGALSGKTVLLVTHQVDFLPQFSSVVLMSDGEILHAGPYRQLLATSPEFLDLVNAHKETDRTEMPAQVSSALQSEASNKEIRESSSGKKSRPSGVGQFIKQEQRETGSIGWKPYILYLNQNKGYLYFSISTLCQIIFVVCQILQNSWMAASVGNPNVSTLRLIVVYLVIGFASLLFFLGRSLSVVALGMQSSKSLFSQLLDSLFRAPMSFYDSTPLGRILSRVSADLSILDLDVPFSIMLSVTVTITVLANLAVLAAVTWPVLFVSIPMVYLAIRLQKYFLASSKEFMRINGTSKSMVTNHLAESIAGSVTIRAFEEEDRFFKKNLELIDKNASPFFHNFAATEWLIQRLETLCAIVLASSALCMVLLPMRHFGSGFIGMALSYGLSLNSALVLAIQRQCTLANLIISVERLNQYMHIPSEAPEVIEGSRPPANWPSVGKVEIQDLQIRYRPDAPLVLHGISCTFEGGHKIGIVGRTGSGKTTLIGALFRLVEPAGGRIVVDGIDISTLGLHDLRSRFGIIPQDPTLFRGTVRYNLDPLSKHTDHEIWEVLGKCQLKGAVQQKEDGLDSLVAEDGSNWSMGQRQLFCLGRAILRRSKIVVLDEATASIDNATDLILQRTIKTEFADCTVITVAHRIPTVMDCTMVLAISDGKLVEYDEPMKLMKREDSLFGKLVKDYWSRNQYTDSQ